MRPKSLRINLTKGQTIFLTNQASLWHIWLVKNGMGVTVLPSLVLKENCEGLETVRLSPPIKRKLGVAFKKKRKTFELKLFLEYVKETTKKG